MLTEMHESLDRRGLHVRTGAIVNDIRIQGPLDHCAAAKQWLVTHGPAWGYFLNEEPGKTTLCVGPAAYSTPATIRSTNGIEAGIAAEVDEPEDTWPLASGPQPLCLRSGDIVAYRWQKDGPDGEEAPVYYSVARILSMKDQVTDLHMYLHTTHSGYSPHSTLDLSKKMVPAKGNYKGKFVHHDIALGDIICHVGLNKPDTRGAAFLGAASKHVLVSLAPCIAARQPPKQAQGTSQTTWRRLKRHFARCPRHPRRARDADTNRLNLQCPNESSAG